MERTELLNGTCTITIEGATVDGVWQIAGVVSWNRGLVHYAGEGDLSVTAAEGELFASLMLAEAEGGGEESEDVRLVVIYGMDGGTGRFDAASGAVKGRVRVAGDRFEGDWAIYLGQNST